MNKTRPLFDGGDDFSAGLFVTFVDGSFCAVVAGTSLPFFSSSAVSSILFFYCICIQRSYYCASKSLSFLVTWLMAESRSLFLVDELMLLHCENWVSCAGANDRSGACDSNFLSAVASIGWPLSLSTKRKCA